MSSFDYHGGLIRNYLDKSEEMSIVYAFFDRRGRGTPISLPNEVEDAKVNIIKEGSPENRRDLQVILDNHQIEMPKQKS